MIKADFIGVILEHIVYLNVTNTIRDEVTYDVILEHIVYLNNSFAVIP